MKKLMLILIALMFTISGFSQGLNYHYSNFVVADTITSDTGYQVVMSADYSWLLFGTTASTTTSTSTVTLQVSGNNGTDWLSLSGYSADTLNAVADVWGFQGDYSPGGKYRLYFDVASGETLIVNAWYNLKVKK